MTGVPFFEDYETELREKYGTPGSRIITVSGLVGVGTGTIAQFLAQRYGLEYVDAGNFFRAQAAERGMSISAFDRRQDRIEAAEDVDFDLKWDRTVLRRAFTEDNLLLEGRLTGVLLTDIAPVRVWVDCDIDAVAARLKGRESVAERLPDEEVSDAAMKQYVKRRNTEVLERYSNKYGIDPRNDRFYNVFIDNSGDQETVKEQIVAKIQDLDVAPRADTDG